MMWVHINVYYHLLLSSVTAQSVVLNVALSQVFKFNAVFMFIVILCTNKLQIISKYKYGSVKVVAS